MIDSAAIDKRGRDLVEQLLQLNTDWDEDIYPNLGPQIAAVETTLEDYLREHREVLGRMDFWGGYYAELDESPAPSPLESPPELHDDSLF